MIITVNIVQVHASYDMCNNDNVQYAITSTRHFVTVSGDKMFYYVEI